MICGTSPENVKFLCTLKGQTGKYKNHKCPASSKRLNVLRMSKQKQRYFWIHLHCMSVLVSDVLNSIPLFLVCYDKSSCESIFCIVKFTGLYKKMYDIQIPSLVVLWINWMGPFTQQWTDMYLASQQKKPKWTDYVLHLTDVQPFFFFSNHCLGYK